MKLPKSRMVKFLHSIIGSSKKVVFFETEKLNKDDDESKGGDTSIQRSSETVVS